MRARRFTYLKNPNCYWVIGDGTTYEEGDYYENNTLVSCSRLSLKELEYYVEINNIYEVPFDPDLELDEGL